MGHLAKDCPEKKSKDSSGFAMMCVEGGELPVEEDQEQLNLEVHSEAGLEEKNSEVHLEAQPEQSLLHPDCMDSVIQSPMTENHSCTNEV